MWSLNLPHVLLLLWAVVCGCYGATEEEGRAYLASLEPRYSSACNAQMTARWAYITNVTTETGSISTEADTRFLAFQSLVQSEILANYSNYLEFTDPQLRREFKYLAIKGPASMSPADVALMGRISSGMETAYATVTVCDFYNATKCDLRLDPEIEEKLLESKDWDELAHYWTKWHDVMSEAVRPANYTQLIQLQTQMAKANGFEDMSEMWLSAYDDESGNWTAREFKDSMLSTWEELRPFYDKLAAYVRMKLRAIPEYAGKIAKYDLLPAHLLGNMWAQDWASLDTRTKPYPLAPSLDATPAMMRANFTALRMFEESDAFFKGLGLFPMTDTFWKESMLERPADGRDVVCHASAEDFCLGRNSTDFRIKQCTKVDMDQLVTVHHEMGHIQYFMQYTNEDFIFRDGANPGFHEAIGDALALAVVTPKHLECALKLEMGLGIDCENATKPEVYNQGEVTENDINYLYLTALKKVVFFPFAISMDSWRWEVFEGKLNESSYNSRWWDLRKGNQRINPPSDRSGPNLFDPAAKYHVVASVPYIRYFVSHILQFHFFEAMCVAAGEFDPNSNTSKPLYQCDFAGSAEAGKLIGDMMKLGFSRGWPVALEAMTGSREMTIRPLLNYFKPLFDYIDAELLRNNETACFGDEVTCGSVAKERSSVEVDQIKSQLPCKDNDLEACEKLGGEYLGGRFEREASAWGVRGSLAEWAYSTDLGNEGAREASENLRLEEAKWEKQEYKEIISQFPWRQFKNESLRRQFKYIADLGIAALNESDVSEFTSIMSKMKKVYGTGKICPYTKQECDLSTEGLPLNPDVEHILTNSSDFDELAYVWGAWRNATGRPIRGLYNQFIDLSNKASKANGYGDTGEYWLRKYESSSFRDDLKLLWEDVRPLYEELHAYVRFKLSKVYTQVDTSKPIPANILGNMWSQSWENIYEHVVPFPDAKSFDATPELKKRFPQTEDGVRDMFKVANEFFLSLGLEDMSMSFGEKGLIIKPSGRDVVCHASAWDFSDGKDYRIKMCTNVNEKDFITVHHELGHIQYYIQYNKLPITFRTGANPGFHEAIGDVVALSVSSSKHMRLLGYVNVSEAEGNSKEAEVNFLLGKALERVAFLPFGYLIDSFRWGLFDGSIPRDQITKHWLKLRNELQGVVPPSVRDELDFDAGSKYHVPGNTPYIRYFVSFILQFQVHKELCDTAGHKGALHECDIYGNKAAGLKFKRLMESGFSRNWGEVLSELTDGKVDKLDAGAIKEYFKPLTEFLKGQREELKYPIGWDNNEYINYYSKGQA